MNLGLSEEQELLRDTFARLFAAESSPERVRAAEPSGFDTALWKTLADAGRARPPRPRGAGRQRRRAARGGAPRRAGRAAPRVGAARGVPSSPRRCSRAPTCPSPTTSSRRAARRATRSSRSRSQDSRGTRRAGRARAAPRPTRWSASTAMRWCSSPAATTPTLALANLGAAPVARWSLVVGAAGRRAGRARERRRRPPQLRGGARGVAAAHRRRAHGLARRALEIAADYASERIQFDRPIGAFQGIAHPLADAVTDVEGARLLVVVRGLVDRAAARPTPRRWSRSRSRWAAHAATRAVGARAAHPRRLRPLARVRHPALPPPRRRRGRSSAGDPRDAFVLGAERLWDGADGRAPRRRRPVASTSGYGDAEGVRADRARASSTSTSRPSVRERMHFSWDGHDCGLPARARRRRPPVPHLAARVRRPGARAVGGRGHRRGVRARRRRPVTRSARRGMVAETVMRVRQRGAQARGAAAHRARRGRSARSATPSRSPAPTSPPRRRAPSRDGDDWVIDGQKMFTSGAHLAQYVFLLTRTDPTVAEAQGPHDVPRAARHARASRSSRSTRSPTSAPT